MQNKVIRLLFFLLVFLVVIQLFTKKEATQNPGDEIWISGAARSTIGKEVMVQIENRGETPLVIKNQCPKNPLEVEAYSNGAWAAKSFSVADPSSCASVEDIVIASNKKGKVLFGAWSKGLFGELGKYKISLKTEANGKERVYTHEMEVVPPTFFQNLWRNLLYRPILNVLFFFIMTIPGHSLGWALVFLTLLIKLILLVPNQKALKSQKSLQIIQPQLDALKVKYKDNPQLMAEETMKIWKEHKVNPMGSCLPMLIQFPILIALFYVVKDGLSTFDATLLYSPLQSFNPASAIPFFFGLDLTKVNALYLPIIIGLLQFLQMRLSFAKTKPQAGSQAAMMNSMMQYVLPVMIGVFSASLPAAVGLYWGVSTLFAIGQQVVVNRSKN